MNKLIIAFSIIVVVSGCANIAPPSGSQFSLAAYGHISFPDTKATRAADELLLDHSGQIMVRHTKRAFLLAKGFAEIDGLVVNDELLYVAIALHDLGLEEHFDGPGDFEENGGKAAASYLAERGFDRLSRDVETAISIHSQAETANHPRAEFSLVHRGSLADVTGSGLDRLDPLFVASVVRAFPRRGTKELIISMLERQANQKPESNIGQTYQRVPVSTLIQNAPFND
jgi:hypothetical protein